MSVSKASARTYGGLPVEARRAERRAKFILAAASSVAERGYAATTIGSICATAGLSRRQFYELFSSREEAVMASYDDFQQAARQAVLDAFTATQTDDPATVIHAALTAYANTIAADVARAHVVFIAIAAMGAAAEPRRAAVRQEWAVFIEYLSSQFSGPAPQPAGGFDAAAAMLIGAVNGLLQYLNSQTGQSQPITAYADTLAAVLFTLLYPGRAYRSTAR